MNLNCLLMHFLEFEQEQAKSDLLSDYLSGFPVLNPWPKVFVVIRLLEAIPIVRNKAAMAIPINIAPGTKYCILQRLTFVNLVI
jgi:hypothetical protein